MRQKQGKKRLTIKRMAFFAFALFFCASLFTNISNIVAAQNNVFKIVDVSMDYLIATVSIAIKPVQV